MNIEKLNGLIEGIEAESHKPLPSHNNLARLVAMALKEVVADAYERDGVKTNEPQEEKASA